MGTRGNCLGGKLRQRLCCWGGGSSGAVDICCWKPPITEAAAGSGISGLKGERQERGALGCDSDQERWVLAVPGSR